MEEMQYEYLLRRIYQTERDFKTGADADIYRKMLHAFRNLETKTLYTTQDEREYDFRKKFAVVRMNVDTALSVGRRQILDRASTYQMTTLQEFSGLLRYDFYDKIILDNIVKEANVIFKDLGFEL